MAKIEMHFGRFVEILLKILDNAYKIQKNRALKDTEEGEGVYQAIMAMIEPTREILQLQDTLEGLDARRSNPIFFHKVVITRSWGGDVWGHINEMSEKEKRRFEENKYTKF